jgi:CheY-like chemotaxis protein
VAKARRRPTAAGERSPGSRAETGRWLGHGLIPLHAVRHNAQTRRPPYCLVCLVPIDSRAVTSVKRALILVVDDEEAVRELIADVLGGHGYEVEMARDGDDALRLCEQGRYDLILSDLRMPKMDGAALYRALQEKYGLAMPRMIFVTGQAHALDYAGFLGVAAVPVLAKPFTVEDLRKAVTQVLGMGS